MHSRSTAMSDFAALSDQKPRVRGIAMTIDSEKADPAPGKSGEDGANECNLSRRSVLLASTALAAASAMPASEMAWAQQKPAAAPKKKPAEPKTAAQPAPAASGQKPSIL